MRVEKYEGVVSGVDSSGSGLGPVADSLVGANELSRSIKCGEFLD
jgi:hypothetical protein